MKSFFKSRRAFTEEDVRAALREAGDLEAAGVACEVAVHGAKVGVTLSVRVGEEKTGMAWRARCEEALRARGVEATVVLTAERPSPSEVEDGKKRAQWSATPVEGVGRIVVVASGKGGVGKSTVSAGLAVALARLGKRAGLLDADIYGPSVPRLMGLQGKPALNDAGKFIPLCAQGVECMSVGFVIPGEAAVFRGPMISKTLHQLLRGTAWGSAGVSGIGYRVSDDDPLPIPDTPYPTPDTRLTLFVDMPPGTGDIHLSMAQQVPLGHGGGGAVIVTTPQEVALDDARKALRMFAKVGVPILGVIENMSWYEPAPGARVYLFGQGGGRRLAEEAGAPFLGEIPFDPVIRAAGDLGAPPPSYAAYEAILETLK